MRWISRIWGRDLVIRLSVLKTAGESLPKLKQDYETLKTEVEPFLWMTPWLKWVPTYGSDIASVPQLIDLADPLLASVDLAYGAVSPLLDGSGLAGLTPTDLSAFLVKAQPQLVGSRIQGQPGCVSPQKFTGRNALSRGSGFGGG